MKEKKMTFFNEKLKKKDIKKFKVVSWYRCLLMKENTEYLELFIIVDDTKFQQGQENLIFFLENLY